jgi:hypothetical protein
MTGQWFVGFDQPAAPLSMNQKQDRDFKQRHQLWRDAAYFAYCQAFPGAGPSGRSLPPCVVHTLIPVATRSRRDPSNFQATVKPIVDGIQRAGAWPDDTPEWVDQRNPRFYHCANRRMEVIVRLEEMT